MPFTFDYSEGNKNFNVSLALADGTEGGMYGYAAPVWSMIPDPSPAASLNPSGNIAGDMSLMVKGVPGIVTISAVFNKTGAPSITVTDTVTITGPVPDHAVIHMLP